MKITVTMQYTANI